MLALLHFCLSQADVKPLIDLSDQIGMKTADEL